MTELFAKAGAKYVVPVTKHHVSNPQVIGADFRTV
jgi:transposase